MVRQGFIENDKSSKKHMSDGVLRKVTSAAKFLKSVVNQKFSVIGFGDTNLEKLRKKSKGNTISIQSTCQMVCPLQ